MKIQGTSLSYRFADLMRLGVAIVTALLAWMSACSRPDHASPPEADSRSTSPGVGSACRDAPKSGIGPGARDDRGPASENGKRDAGAGEGSLAEPVLEDARNILVVGFDRSRSGPGRTDAMLVVSLRYGGRDVGVVSIPRDLWVSIPDLGMERINTVYRLVEARKGKGKGMSALKQVVRRELGIRVNRSVEVTYDGFVHAIDAVGGIPVRVPCPIEDRFMDPDAGTGSRTLSLEAGQHLLDGATALLYVRSRHGRGDYDRGRRQQAVLMGLRTRLLSLDAIPRLPDLWNEVGKSVTTDLGVAEAIRIGAALLGVRAWDIHGLVLGEPFVVETRTPDGRDVLLPDRNRIAEGLKRLFESSIPGVRKDAPCPAKDVALTKSQ